KQDKKPATAATNYVPPPPEELFGDSQLLNQAQQVRSERRRSRQPITQQNRQPASGSAGNTKPEPSQEEQLYSQALESDISIGGDAGNNNQSGKTTQTEQQIQEYRQEA